MTSRTLASPAHSCSSMPPTTASATVMPRVDDVGLVEHADADAATPRDPPAVGFEPAGEQLQQGRLAVAVAADHADAVALVDAEGDLVEDGARRELEVQALGAEEVCHVLSSLVAAIRGPSRSTALETRRLRCASRVPRARGRARAPR